MVNFDLDAFIIAGADYMYNGKMISSIFYLSVMFAQFT